MAYKIILHKNSLLRYHIKKYVQYRVLLYRKYFLHLRNINVTNNLYFTPLVLNIEMSTERNSL